MTKDNLYSIFKALYKEYGQDKAIEILDSLIDCLNTDSLMTLKNELKK